MADDTRSALEEAGLEPDPVIEFYKKDVDRTLIRENLKLSVEERLRKGMALMEFAAGLRAAGRKTFG